MTNEPMDRDVASLLVRMAHRLDETGPGLMYDEVDLVELDDRLIRQAVAVLEADPNKSPWERRVVTDIREAEAEARRERDDDGRAGEPDAWPDPTDVYDDEGR